MLSELFQYVLEMFCMVLWVGRVNKKIVKETQDEFVQILTNMFTKWAGTLATSNGIPRNS